MNHKYLHAINVWTKELERLSRENFFSHEKRCFKLQCIFNFVSSIANLTSQGLLRLTLSRPQNSKCRGRRTRVDAVPWETHPCGHKKSRRLVLRLLVFAAHSQGKLPAPI